MPVHTRSTLIWVLQIEHTVADILFEIENVIGQAIQEEPIEDSSLESSADFLLQAIQAYITEAELNHIRLQFVDNVAGEVDFSMLSRTIVPHLTVQSDPPVDDITYVLSALTSLAAQVKASSCDDDAGTIHRQFARKIPGSPIGGEGADADD